MDDKIFTKIFSVSLKRAFPDWSFNLDEEDLEDTLQDFVYNVIGFSLSQNYNLSEVRAYFDNICRHLNFMENRSLVDAINNYRIKYLELLENHPYTHLFIKVIKRLYSNNYDGSIVTDSSDYNLAGGAQIKHYSDYSEHDSCVDYIIIAKQNIKDGFPLPNIKISSIDEFEEILKNYIECIKQSETFYNIFTLPGNFASISDDLKTMMILEGTIFNASNYELVNVANFFVKYINFITDESFKNMTSVEKMGDIVDDELYVKVRKSTVEYETPYYFSFVLKKHDFELPNVRLGIRKDGEKSTACIVATQSSQVTPRNPEISRYIKDIIPKTPEFRQFNPDHLVSTIIVFGVLKGMGINDIEVIDYMPLRCYKTIKNRNMNEEEANDYMTRVINKNLFTFFKLASIFEGIDIDQKPDGAGITTIYLGDKIDCKSEPLMYLYKMGYEYGKSHKLSDERIIDK